MENQYNYYNTGENDSNNIFDEQPKSSYGQNSSDEKPPKRRKKLPKVVAIAGSAILFGVVASMTFFAASRIADKLFGDSGGQNVIEEQEGIPDSSNIKLNSLPV